MSRYPLLLLIGIVASVFGAGCSLVATKPTVWRPDVSPHVTEMSRAKDEGWRGVGSFSVGGIGDSDSMYTSYLVSGGFDRTLNKYVKTGFRAGLLFGQVHLTAQAPVEMPWRLIPAAQLHIGVNSFDDGNHAVTDGSLMIGRLLTTGMTSDNDVPASILYVGIRRGWVGDITKDNNATKVGTRFESSFVGLELWLTRFGLSLNLEFVNPDNPRHMGWNTDSEHYLLVSSGLRYLIR